MILKVRTKILVIVLSTIAMLQAGYLLHVQATLVGKQETIKLYRKNVELRERLLFAASLYRDKTVEACALRIRWGSAYRVVLVNLVEDLGLGQKRPGRPMSVTARMLAELEVPKDLYSPDEFGGGMGGPLD